jgi:hypothetical protein
MRTTLNINDRLLQTAKKRAIETNRTLTAVIEDALRQSLEGKVLKPAKRRVNLPTSGEGGLLPRVDLDNMSDLQDIMDERL